MAAEAVAAGNAEDEAVDEEDGAPIDILSKDFYEKLKASKWKEREEALNRLEQQLQAPRLESGEYGDVVRALMKIISEDAHEKIVAAAGRCLARLALGLKKRFRPYAGACIRCILEKLRETNKNVLHALQEAIDAVFLSTTIEAIKEDVLRSLEKKNPQVKAETAYFLARCFTKCTPIMLLNKDLLKAYTTALLKTLNDADPTVRDCSEEALGTAMKVVGGKQLKVFLKDLDDFKMINIEECCDMADIVAEVPKTDCPSTAPASASAAKVKSAKFSEKDLSEEEVDVKAAAFFPQEIISELDRHDLKGHLSTVKKIGKYVILKKAEVPTQVVIRILNKMPRLKDFQVIAARLKVVKLLAENAKFTSELLGYCITDIAELLGDVKNGKLAAETLTSLAEATELELVAAEVIKFAFIQKSPEVQRGALVWLSTAMRDFGFQSFQPVPIMNVNKAESAANPRECNLARMLMAALYMYLKAQPSGVFKYEKFDEIEEYCDMAVMIAEVPKTDCPGMAPASASAAKFLEKEMSQKEVDEMAAATFSEEIIFELSNSNWKTRLSAVVQLTQYVFEKKAGVPTEFVIKMLYKTPGLKDTNFQVLKARLEVVKLLARYAENQSVVLGYCITDIAELLGDVENGKLAAETLTSLARSTNLELVATEVINFAFIRKSAKVQQGALLWLSIAMREPRIPSFEPFPIMKIVNKAESAANPAVCNLARMSMAALCMYLKAQPSGVFKYEKFDELFPIQHSPSNSEFFGVDAMHKHLDELKGSARESQ